MKQNITTEKEVKLAKLQWQIDQATIKLEELEKKIDCLNIKVDKVDEKVTVVDRKVDKVENKVDDTMKALAPVTKIIYGLVGLILVGFFTVVAAYVFRTPIL